MKNSTRNLLNGVLIFGVPVGILVYTLCSGDLLAALRELGNADVRWMLLALLSMAGFLFLSGESVWSSLKRQGYLLPRRLTVSAAIVGEFYSNITPGASGGQPMEIYRLHRYGVPVGVGTSATMTRFVAYHIAAFLLTTVLGAVYWPFLKMQVGANMPILIVGYAMNTLATGVVLLLSLVRQPVHWLIDKVVSIGSRLHVIRDAEKTRQSFRSSADTFYDSVLTLRRHKAEVLRQLLLCSMQLFLYMCVPYFIYRGLGLSGVSGPKIVMMALMEYMSAAYVPLPGASGAREGVFSLYFDQIFTGANALAAMLIWRFITYYSTLLVGASVSVVSRLTLPGKKKDE